MKKIFMVSLVVGLVFSGSFAYAKAGHDMSDMKMGGGDMKMGSTDMKKETAAYPLSTCIVSGQSLDAMGGAVDYTHEGKLIKFCCQGCVAIFQKNPQKYLTKLEELEKKEKKTAGVTEETVKMSDGHEGHVH